MADRWEDQGVGSGGADADDADDDVAAEPEDGFDDPEELEDEDEELDDED